jgi:WD40 repeat protein/serine/threonine protein kinase
MGEKRNEDSNKTIRQSDVRPGVAQAAGAKAEQDMERTIAALPRKAEEIRAAEAEVPLEWNIGDVILDLYEVKDIHKGGGMGLVYRVRHRGWNIDLAVKSPRADYFQTEEQKKNFVRECETWINLGLYPHTVSCYYVRMLGGIPRVFAEYVEGGSLSDWIKTRKLYEGGPDKALERILDIAIQFAWGLHYAHEQGLIHQDVKPANVMMTPDGTAKVTDFGLAKARGLAGESARALPGRNVLVSSGGMTPAYCSPEQARGKPLSRKTDIWSWGLSVLEMFTGEVTWMAGQAAAEVLESYIETGAEDEAIPKMPEATVELLRRCFQRDPEDRPEDMKDIITKLMQSYQGATGEEYARPEPKAADLLADGLNNRAISLLDLGRQDEAEKLFERALQSDPHQLEATFNRGLLLWRSGRMTDDVLAKQLEEVRTTHEGDWRVGYHLGLVHMERGDGESAVTILEGASRQAPQEEEIQRALEVARSSQGERHSWVRTFEGHTYEVRSVTFSPDGCWALSGSGDNTLRLWDLATGQCLRTFEGHKGGVDSVSISPDGCWGLSGSWDNTLRLWELATGRCVRTFEGHTLAVISVSISPDGRWALSGSNDEKLRLWELATGRYVRTFEGHTWVVNSVSISPDGCWALSGSKDKTLRLWELATGRCVRTFEGHTSVVSSVSISPDGRWALSGSYDKTLRLWELATGKCVRAFEGHTNEVCSVTFSPDGCWALSGSYDKTLRLWELATGKCVRTFEGHTWVVNSVSISPDGRWALSGSNDETLRRWELKRGGPPASLAVARPQSSAEVIRAETEVRRALESAKSALGQGDASRAAAEVSRARRIPGYEKHGELLELWPLIKLRGKPKSFSGGWLRRTFEGHTNEVSSVTFSPDGCWALSGSWDKTLRLWELATGRCVRTFENAGAVTSVHISPDGRWGLSGSGAHKLRLWELATGNCVRTFEGYTNQVDSVSISPDGRWGLSGSLDKTLRLWELATGQCKRTFEGHTAGVSSVSISPDGRWGLSGSYDYTPRLWELATGQCLCKFVGHTHMVRSVSISPDGRWGLSGSGDKTLRLWELATGQCVRTFEGHADDVKSVTFSPDGRWGLSGSGDKTLRLWELATGQCVRTFEGHKSPVASVSISPDGRWALSGGGELLTSRGDNTLRLWELDWECEFPSPADWDEGARPHLESFISLHTPYAAELPQDHAPSEEEVRLALTHRGKPSWNEKEFDALIRQLQYAGYGWLRPEGVRRQLEEMAKKPAGESASASILSKLFGKKS